MRPIVAQVYVQLSHKNGLLFMVTKLNLSCSHYDWCTFCTLLRSLNVRHFRTLEATRLKTMASRSPIMSMTSVQDFMKIHQLAQTLLVGIHRQRDYLINIALSF
jgi:hypothetical protein